MTEQPQTSGYGDSWWSGPSQGSHFPVPQYQQQPQFTLPNRWRYRPRRNHLENKAVRAGVLIVLLSMCGLVILALVQRTVGTEGFFVGLGLAVFPVPLLLGTFTWIDRVEPEPRRNLVFAFAWGACAATLVAIIANSWTTQWLGSINDQSSSDALSSIVVAPVVEECAKGAAILLLYLFRRKDVDGVIDGVVIAGIAATGFAFTENVLYLGQAFGEDLALGSGGLGEVTIVTFFMRVIMSPFAHPLFTCMTGVGFGIAATTRHRPLRVLAPIGGLLVGMVLHGVWNASSTFGLLGFVLTYGILMAPVFALMVWLVVWSRNNELKTVGKQLPVYALAGWISHPEAAALSSMKARKLARDIAQHTQGKIGARTMREYQGYATALAFLRSKADRGMAGADFAAREQELLHHLWQRKESAGPALTRAAFTLVPPVAQPGAGFPGAVPPGAVAPGALPSGHFPSGATPPGMGLPGGQGPVVQGPGGHGPGGYGPGYGNPYHDPRPRQGPGTHR